MLRISYFGRVIISLAILLACAGKALALGDVPSEIGLFQSYANTAKTMGKMLETAAQEPNTTITIKKDNKGNIIEATNSKNPKVVGFRFKYDEMGNLTEMSSYDKNWKLTADDTFLSLNKEAGMTAIIRSKYDQSGSLIETSSLDSRENLILSEYRKLNQKGQTIEYGKRGADGLLFSGSVLSRYSYDQNGNVTWEQYFDNSGNLAEKIDVTNF